MSREKQKLKKQRQRAARPCTSCHTRVALEKLEE